jgi:hypothetical protein
MVDALGTASPTKLAKSHGEERIKGYIDGWTDKQG